MAAPQEPGSGASSRGAAGADPELAQGEMVGEVELSFPVSSIRRVRLAEASGKVSFGRPNQSGRDIHHPWVRADDMPVFCRCTARAFGWLPCREATPRHIFFRAPTLPSGCPLSGCAAN